MAPHRSSHTTPDHSGEKAGKKPDVTASGADEVVIPKALADLMLRWSYAVLGVLPPGSTKGKPEDPRDIENTLVRLSQEDANITKAVERLRQISMRIANLVVATHSQK